VAELLDCGVLLRGEDIRERFAYPTHEQLNIAPGALHAAHNMAFADILEKELTTH